MNIQETPQTSSASAVMPCWANDDGSVQLYHDDCLDVLPFLHGVDAVITDPPYGIGFAAQPTKWQRKAGTKPKEWDNAPADAACLLDIADIIVIWGGNYFFLPPSRGWFSWYKPDAPPSMASMELAWTNKDMNSRQIMHSISATNKERVGHPTQKPVRVMIFCMDGVSVPLGATVLDPFMGSGTTGIACIRSGRKFIGIEKDEKYYEIAKKRIQKELQQGRLW